MRWTDHVILAFDTETTGLSPENGDRVIELAAVEMRADEAGQVRDVRRHEFLFSPGAPLSADTTRITGIRDEDLLGKPSFEDCAAEVRALFDRPGILVAHNLPFDLRFLAAELARAGLRWPSRMVELDTYDVARKHLPSGGRLPDYKLGTLTSFLGVQLVEAHRAGNDAEACGRALIAMAQRAQAPHALDAFVAWAEALPPPPENPHIGRADSGDLVFLEGPHATSPIDAHPDVLQWMGFARERTAEGTWQMRYPPEVRAWVGRYLRIRASGRFPSGLKAPGPSEWGIDLPVGADPRASA
jgi:DNA polymerase III epsilon subunit-like protein